MTAPDARAVLLDVRGLRTYFDVEGRTAKAVDGVDLTIGKDQDHKGAVG